MPIELPTTKKQRLFILVLVVVVIIIGVVIWWGLAPTGPAKENLISADKILEKELMKGIPTKLDLSIFDHPWFEKARIYGKMPVEAGVTGRDNPFKPF